MAFLLGALLLLPLVEPDVRISRIRLSCKLFVMGGKVRVVGDTGNGSCLWADGIYADYGDSDE